MYPPPAISIVVASKATINTGPLILNYSIVKVDQLREKTALQDYSSPGKVTDSIVFRGP